MTTKSTFSSPAGGGTTTMKQHIIEIEIFQSIFDRNKFGSAMDDPRLNSGFWSRDFLAAAIAAGLRYLPQTFGVHFGVPMPKHWSKVQKSAMIGQQADAAFESHDCVRMVVDAFVRYDRTETADVPTILFADTIWTEKPNVIMFVPERGGHWLFARFRKMFS